MFEPALDELANVHRDGIRRQIESTRTPVHLPAEHLLDHAHEEQRVTSRATVEPRPEIVEPGTIAALAPYIGVDRVARQIVEHEFATLRLMTQVGEQVAQTPPPKERFHGSVGSKDEQTRGCGGAQYSSHTSVASSLQCRSSRMRSRPIGCERLERIGYLAQHPRRRHPDRTFWPCCERRQVRQPA